MRAIAALVCLLIISIPADAAEWVRVETPHLIVYGPGEKRTREVLAEFERFREAISQILPNAAIVSAVPTIVVAFENDAAFNPYRPLFNGKPVKLAGFYTGTESDNMIAFPHGDRANGQRIIFHEYTHVITANGSGAMPAWVNEGLAEFYSTFEIRPDGKQAVLGHVVPEHIALLNANSQWLSLDQLLNVTRDSPLYNEGERRSIFYAQSWAIVHMFMTGRQNRSKELSQYVQLASGGMAPRDAWQRAFGDFDVQKALRGYLAQFSMRGFLYKFPEGIEPVKGLATKPPAAEVEAVLSRLRRFGSAKEDDVQPQLTRAVAMTPPSMLAHALLGHTYVQGKQADEGVRLLTEAAADTSDWLTQYYVANGLVGWTRKPDEDVMRVARAAVERVIAARPQLAHGYALKAHLVEGVEAVTHVRKARALAPGRPDYVFLEAQVQADVRDYAAARSALAPLLTPNYPQRVRDHARVLMGQIVRIEELHKKATASPPSRPEAPASSPPANVYVVYREVKPGEQRLEGTLQRIDCTRMGTVTLVVQADGVLKRFTAAQFSDIEFLTYRQPEGGSISCGERKPPDAVYVTWLPLSTPASGITGRPVAVEFLPEKR